MPPAPRIPDLRPFHRVPDLPPEQLQALMARRLIRLMRTGVSAADAAMLFCVTPAVATKLFNTDVANQRAYQRRIDLKGKHVALAAKRAALAAAKSTT